MARSNCGIRTEGNQYLIIENDVDLCERDINNRMQLETQYKNLIKQRVSVGEKFVRDVAYDAAKNTASEYARKYTKKGVKFVFDSLI